MQRASIANTEMAGHWDGAEGDDWTDYADQYDASGQFIGRGFLERVPITSTDRVLDVGCGTGRSTRDVARCVPEGGVLGVDLSARMIELARRRTAEAGLSHVEYVQADAQVHPFDRQSFDVAISAFGTIFFADPLAAFANIGRGLRPGAWLVMQSWRSLADNEWLLMMRTALSLGRDLPVPPTSAPGPFGLADPEHVRRVLTGAGFVDVHLAPVDAPIYFGPDVDRAFAFVVTMGIVRGLTNGLDAADKQRALDATRAALAAHLSNEGVAAGGASWVITARRA